jgi:hypothetical protein
MLYEIQLVETLRRELSQVLWLGLSQAGMENVKSNTKSPRGASP